MKAILAIIGLNIFFEHPVIVLGVIGIIIFLAYSYHESQKEEATATVTENNADYQENNYSEGSAYILSLVENKKLSQLDDDDREEVYEYYLDKMHYNNNVNLSNDEKVFIAMLMNKIMEYEDTTKMLDMQPIERKKIYLELNMYDEHPENLSEKQQIRRGILAMKKVEYMAESTLPVDKVGVYLRLVGKKAGNKPMTAKESREFEKLNAIVFDNFVED